MSKGDKTNNTRIFTAVFSLAVWSILTFCEHDLLIKTESHSLFLFNSLYLTNCLWVIGGMLAYIGTFFSQFLYIPWLGALIYTLLLAAAAHITYKAYRIPQRWSIVAFIPSVLLLAGSMSAGYTLFTNKSPGFFFSPLIGYIVASSMLWAFSRLNRPILKIVFSVISGTIGYHFLGMWALLGLLAIATYSVAEGNSRRWTHTCIAILLAIGIPLIATQFNTDYRIADIYTIGMKGLPYNANYLINYLPFILTAVFTVITPAVLSILSRVRVNLNNTSYATSQALIIVIYCLIIWGFWFTDHNFRAEIKMSIAVDRMNWEKVLNIHQRYTKGNFDKVEPTRLMVQYRNLALVKLKKEGEQLYSFRDGGKKQNSPELLSLMIQGGKQLYLHYGLLNYSYRWCIEDAVEYGWNIQDLKYAVMSSLLSGDTKVTEKYLNLLDNTLFHRKWAESQKSFLNQPSAIADAPQYKDIIPIICHDNIIDNDQVMIELYLIRYFTRMRPSKPSAEFDRIALMWATGTQDIPTFWRCFMNYMETNQVRNMPRYYQEAALLYGNLEKTVDISNMPFDRKVTDTYNTFNKYVSTHPASSLDQARHVFYDRFGRTFFYYYYFIRNLKSY